MQKLNVLDEIQKINLAFSFIEQKDCTNKYLADALLIYCDAYSNLYIYKDARPDLYIKLEELLYTISLRINKKLVKIS